jgi:hypothetical protein
MSNQKKITDEQIAMKAVEYLKDIWSQTTYREKMFFAALCPVVLALKALSDNGRMSQLHNVAQTFKDCIDQAVKLAEEDNKNNN